MNDKTDTLNPITKRVTVPLSIEDAFELFTSEMSTWWPLAVHSVFQIDAVSVTMEPIVGGQIVEIGVNGQTSVWGTITRWEPHTAVSFTWHPGRNAEEATAVSVTFAAAADGQTAVGLVHAGWEGHADGGTERTAYDEGWNGVLSLYVAAGSARTESRRPSPTYRSN